MVQFPARISLISPQDGATYTIGQSIPIEWSADIIGKDSTGGKNNQVEYAVTAISTTGGGVSGGTGQTLSALPFGVSSGSNSWATGPGHLEAPGTYEVSVKIRECNIAGCNVAPPGKVLSSNSVARITIVKPLALVAPIGSYLNGAVLGASTSFACTNLLENIHRGAESTDVSNLQSFLLAKGLLTDTPSGFYGDKTVEGVKNYQASKGLPATGMVYDFTRQAIKAESCR